MGPTKPTPTPRPTKPTPTPRPTKPTRPVKPVTPRPTTKCSSSRTDKRTYKCSALTLKTLKCCKGLSLITSRGYPGKCYPNYIANISGYSKCAGRKPAPVRPVKPTCSSYKTDRVAKKCSDYKKVKCCKGEILIRSSRGAKCYPSYAAKWSGYTQCGPVKLAPKPKCSLYYKDRASYTC